MTNALSNIDFESIPKDLEGLWVVLRLGPRQEIISRGQDPQEAIRESRVDLKDPQFALTQVPRTPTAAWMNHSAEPNP